MQRDISAEEGPDHPTLDTVIRTIRRREWISLAFVVFWTAAMALVIFLFWNRINSLTADAARLTADANRLTDEIRAAGQRIGELEGEINVKSMLAAKAVEQISQELRLQIKQLAEGANLASRAEPVLRKLIRDQLIEESRQSISIADWNGALKRLNEAAAMQPDTGETSYYWILYQSRGFANMMTGNASQARADFEKAAELRRSSIAGRAGSLENIALISLREGKWDEAYRQTEEVNKISANSPWNWLFRSIAADQLGNKSEAEAARTKWQSLRPRVAATDIDLLRSLLPDSLHSYLF